MNKNTQLVDLLKLSGPQAFYKGGSFVSSIAPFEVVNRTRFYYW